ncbi:hypothetical protein [Rahnella sp. EDr1-12]|uniref:hypothetical protein n=1 Tax=unclassified Rahnella TaxID=2635087 RepID=UPI003BACFFF5
MSETSSSIQGHVRGKTYEWVTNIVGKFPAIFHTNERMSIAIKSKDPKGKEKIIYRSTMSDQTKKYTFKEIFFTIFG